MSTTGFDDQFSEAPPPAAVSNESSVAAALLRAHYTTSSGAGYKQISLQFAELDDAELVRKWLANIGTKPSYFATVTEPAYTTMRNCQAALGVAIEHIKRLASSKLNYDERVAAEVKAKAWLGSIGADHD